MRLSVPLVFIGMVVQLPVLSLVGVFGYQAFNVDNRTMYIKSRITHSWPEFIIQGIALAVQPSLSLTSHMINLPCTPVAIRLGRVIASEEQKNRTRWSVDTDAPETMQGSVTICRRLRDEIVVPVQPPQCDAQYHQRVMTFLRLQNLA